MAKKQITFVTPYNFDPAVHINPEVSSEELMTIPGMSESLRTIEAAYSRKPDITINRPTYDELINADFRNMDRVERHMFRKNLAHQMKVQQERIQLSEAEKIEQEKIAAQQELELLRKFKAEVDARTNGVATTEGAAADSK
jgi:hypothetical protein